MSIGQALATARREAGLTIQDVGRATCIRETIIRGIERDDFELCGGNFYARGHIRSIGHAVGIDPQPLVDQYDEEHGGSPRAVVPAEGWDAGDRAHALDRRRRRPNWSMVMAVVLVAVVVFGVFQLFGGLTDSGDAGGTGGGVGGQQAPVAKATEPSGPPDGGAAKTGPGDAESSPAGSKDKQDEKDKKDKKDQKNESSELDEATIRLEARAPTWISATGSGGEEFYRGTLKSGDSVEFTDKKRIRLVIGNLGGVALTINGKDFGVMGEPGAVEGLRVYPDRIEGVS